MLGLQGNASPTKVYRCVACSATFTGLASLLVHQASHASEIKNVAFVPSKKPNSTESGTIFSKNEPSNQLASMPSLPETPASLFICDCGDGFQDFNHMLEHKSLHVQGSKVFRSMNCKTAPSHDGECGERGNVDSESPRPSSSQVSVAPIYSSHSLNPSQDVLLQKEPVVDNVNRNQKIDVEAKMIMPKQKDSPPKATEKETPHNLLDVSKISTMHDNAQSSPHGIRNNSDPCIDGTVPIDTVLKDDLSPKNKAVMKMVATAYMKRFQTAQYPSKRRVTPKTEFIPVKITTDVKQNWDSPVGRLRRLLTKPGGYSKTHNFPKTLDSRSNSKSIVSLSRTFSPVVVLETRQKLVDFSNSCIQGRYQCGHCRRVFQDVDSLTVHHSSHRKERVKCCRQCKQLIIGNLPLSDHHICPQLLSQVPNQSILFKSKLPLNKKMHYHFKLNQKTYLSSMRGKCFVCPICKHSYARRYNLKIHNCQGPPLPQQAFPTVQEKGMQRENCKTKETISNDEERSEISQNIGVGTEAETCIKTEVIQIPTFSGQTQFSDLVYSGSAKSFSPFVPTAYKHQEHSNAEQYMHTMLKNENENEKDLDEKETADSPQKIDGQWTMPLDDEMEVLDTVDDSGKEESISQDLANSTQNKTTAFFIKCGKNKYPCNKCQKIYSRAATLRRHQRLCGIQSHVRVKPFLGAVPFQIQVKSVLQAMPQNTKIKPMFDCFVCGRSFNRRDNMLVHWKKCQLKQSVAGIDCDVLEPVVSATQALPFGNQSSTSDNQRKEDHGSNWGIMSLPSVLPRRVTCECGTGFTSPRLLLEHLQKHAQESYTCPTCGETVSSWADYEVHLQIHMQPHNFYKGLPPQRSQPLLLRFQQQQPSHSQQRPQVHNSSAIMQHTVQGKLQQRSICMKCNNSFASRGSLRKHIALNRCKGGRSTVLVKSNRCSRCYVDFPNLVSLLFHQRNGICKPTLKPMRCPVCARWFGTVDGLQKHLLTHITHLPESFRCHVCQGTYKNLKSLKTHHRKIHNKMATYAVPVAK